MYGDATTLKTRLSSAPGDIESYVASKLLRFSASGPHHPRELESQRALSHIFSIFTLPFPR